MNTGTTTQQPIKGDCPEMSILLARRDKLRDLCLSAPVASSGNAYIIRTLDMRYIGPDGGFASIEDAARMPRREAVERAVAIRTEHGPAYALHYTDALLACYDAIEDAIEYRRTIIEREAA